jgi:hypothetical protein
VLPSSLGFAGASFVSSGQVTLPQQHDRRDLVFTGWRVA